MVKTNLEDMKKANDVGVANRRQEVDLTVQGGLEVTVEFGEIDLLQSHYFTATFLLSLPNC